jgi:hypothetical protein
MLAEGTIQMLEIGGRMRSHAAGADSGRDGPTRNGMTESRGK